MSFQVEELEEDRVWLRYMVEVKPGVYKWPLKLDRSLELESQIVRLLSKPVLIEELSSSRTQYYKFV